jgi:hypothetical protein
LNRPPGASLRFPSVSHFKPCASAQRLIQTTMLDAANKVSSMDWQCANRIRLVGLAMLLLATGCSRAPAGPDTVPVTGQVTFVRGGPAKVLADRQAVIEFESIEQPGVFAYGEIQEDGRFELTSVASGVKKPGAIKGQHRFRLRLDESARQFVAPQFIEWQETKVVVTQPNEHVEVKVWR